MTSSHHAPYTLGYTRATLGKTKSCEFKLFGVTLLSHWHRSQPVAIAGIPTACRRRQTRRHLASGNAQSVSPPNRRRPSRPIAPTENNSDMSTTTKPFLPGPMKRGESPLSKAYQTVKKEGEEEEEAKTSGLVDQSSNYLNLLTFSAKNSFSAWAGLAYQCVLLVRE